MTHEELLTFFDKTIKEIKKDFPATAKVYSALRAVVELHKPKKIPDWVPTDDEFICWCAHTYPCPTIRAIEKEME